MSMWWQSTVCDIDCCIILTNSNAVFKKVYSTYCAVYSKQCCGILFWTLPLSLCIRGEEKVQDLSRPCEAKSSSAMFAENQHLQVKIQAFEQKMGDEEVESEREDESPGPQRRHSLCQAARDERKEMRFNRWAWPVGFMQYNEKISSKLLKLRLLQFYSAFLRQAENHELNYILRYWHSWHSHSFMFL